MVSIEKKFKFMIWWNLNLWNFTKYVLCIGRLCKCKLKTWSKLCKMKPNMSPMYYCCVVVMETKLCYFFSLQCIAHGIHGNVSLVDRALLWIGKIFSSKPLANLVAVSSEYMCCVFGSFERPEAVELSIKSWIISVFV